MELPNGAMVFTDPWKMDNPLERFYLVLVRLKDGNAPLMLIKTDQGEEHAVEMGLANLPGEILKNIKDVRSILMDDIETYSDEEVRSMILKAVGL